MLTAQPAHRAPATQVHGNSMHPKVRAVLERGLGSEWNSAEVQELLGLSERATQYLFSMGALHITRYPSKNTAKTVRRTTGLSLLLYLVKITEADAQPIVKKVLPLLTDQLLEGVAGACKALISARSGVLVAVKPAAESAPAEESAPGTAAQPRTPRPRPDPYAGMAELFPAASAGEPTANATSNALPEPHIP